MSNDALADLGLDLGTEAVTETIVASEVGTVEEVLGAAPTEATAKREEVAIADIELGFADFIPAQKRGGAGGSKYDEFENLAAPVLKDEADPSKGFKYATATVKPENADNFDADRLKRSVQSAVTAANKASKDAGTPNRYLTRQAIVGGVFVGVTVFRVDGTQNTDAAE